MEDFTLITQNQMLEKMDSILNILTLAVAALGGVSLLVGSVGILTIMTIAVSERISEIGLLRALGAERRTIFQLFLCEALALSTAGGICGVLLGMSIVQILDTALPALPVANGLGIYRYGLYGLITDWHSRRCCPGNESGSSGAFGSFAH